MSDGGEDQGAEEGNRSWGQQKAQNRHFYFGNEPSRASGSSFQLFLASSVVGQIGYIRNRA